MNQKLLSSNEETRQQKIDNAINYLYQDAMSTLTDKMLDDIDMTLTCCSVFNKRSIIESIGERKTNNQIGKDQKVSKDPVKDNKNKKCSADEKNENSKAIDKKNTVVSIKQDESTTKTLKRKPNVSKSFSSSFNCKGMKPTIVNTKPLCDEVIIHRNKKEQNKPRLSIEESNKEPEHLSFKCRREMWEQRTT
ncbi:hypothetical protein BLOT_002212 [Blomia tropicalis]|nr:hypothetical protein BLOT_002212 [Blomia tropicalis]